ncbi:hypothetical protein SAMN04487843_1304 [Methylobacterium sp. ap11]|nr:hypothetical protein SAMN04487843_1304 [Methylobacterium sp. ap11]
MHFPYDRVHNTRIAPWVRAAGRVSVRDGSGRWGLGLAALAAVAIPFAVIAVLDPRIGLLRSRPASEAGNSSPGQTSSTQASPAQAPSTQTSSPQAPAPPLSQGPMPGPPASPSRRPWTDEARPQAAERPCPVCTAEAGPVTIRGTLADQEIQVPDVTAERTAQRERLIGWTAHPDRVPGSAATLDLIGLVYTAPREAGAGYRPLAIDLSEAPGRAVVVVTEQPVSLGLATVPADRAGALGVESSAAFTLAEGRPGLLAGFRALPYGAAEVAPVLDPLRFGPGTRRGFCEALRLWAVQFGLPAGRTRYTLIENPTRIALAGEALRTDGTTRGRVSGPRLARLCRA